MKVSTLISKICVLLCFLLLFLIIITGARRERETEKGRANKEKGDVCSGGEPEALWAGFG